LKPFNQTHRATAAIGIAMKLLSHFKSGNRADPVRTAKLFAKLRLLIRGLPLNQTFSESLAPLQGSYATLPLTR
jgi:hypothetical protein